MANVDANNASRGRALKTRSSAWRVPLSVLLVIAGLAVVAGVAFIVARSATSAATFACKETLQLAAGKEVDPELPAPWRLSITGGARPHTGLAELPLTGVGVFDGPPEQGVVITPQSGNAAATVVQWLFSGSSARGTWLSCDYGGGVLRAVREVAPETTTCEAQLSRAEPRRLSGARFHCR
jgi:hypothetical protein